MEKQIKIPKSEHENIINLFIGGMMDKNIAEIYGVGKGLIRDIRRRHNISEKDRPPRFSDEDIKNMSELYKNGATLQELEKIYNTSDTTIMNRLDLLGVQRRHRKYIFNENYFDNIDDQDKAYLLGFLWADGCNMTQKYSIKLALQEDDVSILNSFRNLIDGDMPLQLKKDKHPNHKDIYCLTLTSKHMSQVLESYGMVRAKSLILEFPTWLDRELYPHFIRGYFDGDGHIVKQKWKYGINIVGTDVFCNYLQDVILTDIGVESRVLFTHNKEKPTRVLYITKKTDTKLFCDYIYKDANLYLQRKYDVYQLKYGNAQNNINNILDNVAS